MFLIALALPAIAFGILLGLGLGTALLIVRAIGCL